MSALPIRIDAGTGEQGAEIIDLFARTFTASDGAAEGAVIRDLVSDLFRTTPEGDLRIFRATQGDRPVGAVLFTRLTYLDDPREVRLLSPMAVVPERQGRGIGQRLITEALAALAADGMAVAITYGDPAFYGRVGFAPISEEVAQAPMPLRAPQGWLGRSLTGPVMPRLAGRPACVPAFARPEVW